VTRRSSTGESITTVTCRDNWFIPRNPLPRTFREARSSTRHLTPDGEELAASGLDLFDPVHSLSGLIVASSHCEYEDGDKLALVTDDDDQSNEDDRSNNGAWSDEDAPGPVAAQQARGRNSDATHLRAGHRYAIHLQAVHLHATHLQATIAMPDIAVPDIASCGSERVR
jgi:hypothetical protein